MRPLFLTLATLVVVAAIGGSAILWQQHNPSGGVAALIALTIEAGLYVAMGFAAARDWLRDKPRSATLLFASGLPAWLIYSVGLGSFRWDVLALLVVLVAVIAWWYRVFPAASWSDVLFMAFLASGFLTKLFPLLFPPLSPKLKTDFIGHLLWLRLSYGALLVIRSNGSVSETTGFGLVPSRPEWLAGARYFAWSMVAAVPTLWMVQPMRFKDNLNWGLTPWIALGTFFGILWVVALSEELFFRGMLLPTISRLTGNAWTGLLLTSVLFGLVHLPYGQFPNWRMVTLASVLGFFCGRAAQVTGGIRAGMVTHALLVTVYRVFLTPK